MNRIVVFLSLLLLFSCTQTQQAPEEIYESRQLTDAEVVAGIKQTFEPVLYQLPARTLGHYGIRLYRMTGDPKYRHAAIVDYYTVNSELSRLQPMLPDKALLNEEALRLTNKLSKGPRGRARRASLAQYPDFIFYAEALLRYAVRVHEFGGEVPDAVRQALASYNFQKPLTDHQMIKAWAAQLANYAYWLKALDIVDLVDETRDAFIAAYPDSQDAKLKKWQFKNKVYGMSHFVFAASRYYQEYVDATEFAWVLDYFRKNKERIFEQTSADVIAEVGITYLLAQKENDNMVLATRKAINRAYVPAQGMIPSVSGKFDLATGEHRNVLAIMLLDWPQHLTPGPVIKP